MSLFKKTSFFTHYLRNSSESIRTLSSCFKIASFLRFSYQTISEMRKKCVNCINRLPDYESCALAISGLFTKEQRILNPIHIYSK